MDYNTGGVDNKENTARLATAMGSPTETHQPSQPASIDRLTQTPMQHSPQRDASRSGAEKRSIDSVCHSSLDPSAKRICSLSTRCLLPCGNDAYPPIEGIVEGIVDDVIEDFTRSDVTTTSNVSCETLQASPSLLLDTFPLQQALAVQVNEHECDTDAYREHLLREESRNEIRQHINIIKQTTPNGQIDHDTAVLIFDELADLMTTMNLATPEAIVQMRCNIAKLNCEAHSLATFHFDRDDSRTIACSPPMSAISELTSVPSDVYTRPPSLCSGSEAVTPPPQTEDRSTQTSTQTGLDIVNAENDASVLPDARYNSLSDIELWERELESIRRLQPLVSGSYTTVKVPLRESTSQLVLESQRTIISVRKSENEENPIHRLKSAAGPTVQSGVVASRNRRYEDSDVISVHDTSDDDRKDVRTRISHIIGGGDSIYNVDEVRHAASDGEEDENFYNPRFRRELQTDGSNDVTESFSEYEDHEMDGYIQGEGAIQHPHHLSAPTTRNDNYHVSSRSYQSGESHSSLFVSENSGEDFQSGNGDPSSITARGRAMTINKGTAIVRRGRSRSPGYQRARSVNKTPYREDRHYHRNYKGRKSPAQIYHEKQHSIGRAYVEGNSRDLNQYGQAGRRYLRYEPEAPQFYGYGDKWPLKEAERTLRYQDRYNDVGEIPGPKSGLRLNLDRYVEDTGINDDALGLEWVIESVYENTFYAGETLDEEQALRASWVNDKTARLYNGFPLVESIGFVTLPNNSKPDGDCYWRALAYTLCGKPNRWDSIKADHQAYLRHVLSDKTHPRHELYAKLNTQFFETHGPILKNGSFNITSAFKANLWQLLYMPHSWTPGVMQQITADLYNIHLITFTYDAGKNMCSDVSIRGAYNSRHVFMLFNGFHFQPLVVNEYLGWEFRYPRVTLAGTARFSNAPKANSRKVKQATQHPWRNDWTKEVPPPVPRNHGCDLFQLRKYMAIPRRDPNQPRR
ncbi:hypothetical protein F4803DRAFT_260828 [Xylaria telfairii]|nr:hypothetical protein F4803DRAFT_260828 [Xylaria telfairii]